MKERGIDPRILDYLGPVAIAQFIELGWFTEWPMMITKGGRRGFERGMGLWQGKEQALPLPTTPSERGVPFWEGRRAHWKERRA